MYMWKKSEPIPNNLPPTKRPFSLAWHSTPRWHCVWCCVWSFRCWFDSSAVSLPLTYNSDYSDCTLCALCLISGSADLSPDAHTEIIRIHFQVSYGKKWFIKSTYIDFLWEFMTTIFENIKIEMYVQKCFFRFYYFQNSLFITVYILMNNGFAKIKFRAPATRPWMPAAMTSLAPHPYSQCSSIAISIDVIATHAWTHWSHFIVAHTKTSAWTWLSVFASK